MTSAHLPMTPIPIGTLRGQDLVKDFNSLGLDSATLDIQRTCLRHLFLIGMVDSRNSPQCQFSEGILLALSILMVSIISSSLPPSTLRRLVRLKITISLSSAKCLVILKARLHYAGPSTRLARSSSMTINGSSFSSFVMVTSLVLVMTILRRTLS